ncbi:MAG: trigger factor [Methylohalobius crimeensis]
MQISVESTSDIGRKMTIQVPEDKIQAEINNRLKSLARQVKVDGFRPGKAPARIIRQRFGTQVREEVLSELIGSSFTDAVKERSLRLAGDPQIKPQDITEGEGMTFEAQFEVYPDIELAAMDTLEVAKPVCEITEADLETMIKRLREQKKSWHEVDRPLQTGDRATITFEGFQENGDPLENGKAEHFQIEIGAGNMIPGFDEKLLDHKSGDHLEFELTFPEDYHHEDIAGKPVLFKVDVEKVEEGRLPEIDAEFAKEYGVESGDVEEFHREVKTNMERQLDQALKEETKNKVLDALHEKNPIPVPEALVKQEIQRMLQPMADALKQNPEILNQLPLDNIKESAKKRVSMGLLLAEIIQNHDIQADSDRVRKTIEEMAQNYEDPQEVVNWYFGNPEQLAQIENLVLEEQAIDWILEQAKISEEPISFEDLMKKQQQRQAA